MMACPNQNSVTHQEQSPAMDEIAHITANRGGDDSVPSELNPNHSSLNNAIISDALSHADHPVPHSRMSSRQLSPIIYTKHHFEDLKLGAFQYTQEMLKRHAELKVSITQRDIARHWRKQVNREYSESHSMRMSLQKQLRGKGLKRFWTAREGPQDKDAPATSLGRNSELAIDAPGENSMDVDEPVTKPKGKASARKRRKAQRQRDARVRADASMHIADSHPQGTVQDEEAMELATGCVHVNETGSHSMSNQISADLEYMIATAPIHKERKILKARSNKAKLTALRTLQLNRIPQSSEPPFSVLGRSLHEEGEINQELMDCD